MENSTKSNLWLIDPVHTKIRFQTRYLLISSVSGWFTQFEGTVLTAADDFNDSEVQLTVYTQSLNTGNVERDNHLRSVDFFDAKNYPMLSFKSESIKINGSRLTIAGSLKVKDVTQSISFDAIYTGHAQDENSNHKAGFEINMTLNRKVFHLNWNRSFDKAGFLLGDEVKIFCDVQLLRVS